MTQEDLTLLRADLAELRGDFDFLQAEVTRLRRLVVGIQASDTGRSRAAGSQFTGLESEASYSVVDFAPEPSSLVVPGPVQAFGLVGPEQALDLPSPEQVVCVALSRPLVLALCRPLVLLALCRPLFLLKFVIRFRGKSEIKLPEALVLGFVAAWTGCPVNPLGGIAFLCNLAIGWWLSPLLARCTILHWCSIAGIEPRGL